MANVMTFISFINVVNESPLTGDEFPIGPVIAVIAVSGLLLLANIIIRFINKDK